MSLLRNLIRNRPMETVEPFDNRSFPWSRSRTGVSVSQTRALQHAAVWACIRLRAETIAALPLGVVEYEGEARTRAETPTWLARPNPETTRYELIERTVASLDCDGNAFWYFERDRIGRIREVWALPPTAVKVWRDPPKRPGDPPGPKIFTVGDEDFTADRILHIPGFSVAGRLRGLSPIDQHRHALGLAVAAEEYGETFFGNGAVMSGVIEAPGDPGRAAVDRMRESFAQDHQGLRNMHKPGLLFGGAKWTQLTIPNDSAQFLETRKYQLAEVTRIFRVPPHKIGDLERATFSNIEHQGIEWVQDGVLPTTARIEAAVRAGGLLETGQHLRFNLDGLLRADISSRYAAYAIGRQWGWLNADDIRAKEDMNPLPDGKGQTYLEPLNMVPAGAPREVAQALARAGVAPTAIAAATGVHVTEELIP